MLPEARDAAYLWDMLDAAKAVQEFIAHKTYHDFAHDRMLRGAIERHIEIIGEAANNVSAPLQTAHPEIPWRRIIAQRNVLVHEYGDIKYDLVWNVATKNIPELIHALGILLSNMPATDTHEQ